MSLGRACSLLVPLLLFAVWAVYELPRMAWQVNPDGIAYLAVARHYAGGELTAAVNAYWGPLLSWLLVPLLLAGVTPLVASKALMFVCGALVVAGVWLVASRLITLTSVRFAVTLAAVPYAMAFASGITTPDILFTAILLFYMFHLLAPREERPGRHDVLAGVFGGLGYLAKSFGLPFFLAHYSLVTIWRIFDSNERKKELRASAVTFGAFFAIVLPWVLVLSVAYGRLTTGTAGAYNLRIVGPGMPGTARSIAQPVEMWRLHALPPATSSIWEDPSFLRLPPWPAAKITLPHLARNVMESCGVLVDIVRRTFPLAIVILPIAAVIAFLQWRRDRSSSLSLLLLAMVIYAGGFVLVFIEERYVWWIEILLLVLTGVVIEFLTRRVPVRSFVATAAVLALFTPQAIATATAVKDYESAGRQFAEIAAELRGGGPLAGHRIAANLDWNDSLFVLYYLGGTFCGVAESGEESAAIRKELDRIGIDRVLVWGESPAPPDYLYGFRLLATSERGQVSLYGR